MLRGGKVKRIYELHGEGKSIRAIARMLGVSRNTIRKYLRSPEVPKPAPRPQRASKLDPYKEYILQRVGEGVDNCTVLLREIRAQGYTGGHTILREFVQPLRRRREPQATVRFETRPGEQAQVDFGLLKYKTPDGKTQRVWVFVMVLSWSRAIYVEFVRRADVATFIRCHLNAFARFGGVPRRCLYDNTKVVVLERDEHDQPVWNPRFLDFALRVGFDIRLCHPYRPQTKGRVESGIKYVKRNFWPGVRFVDLADLNQQAAQWCDTVADVRVHGTTHERPVDRLRIEREHLQPLPSPQRLEVFLREERHVGRDGYVQWENAWYGLPWPWKPGQVVQVQPRDGIVELWDGGKRLAVHARATQRGQRLTHPRQWAGLQAGDGRPSKEALAVQLPTVEVERRPLAAYEALVGAVVAG
ncbi:IS21 family transposase [Caldinitratiruptor microaerophilus]|uniref:IS21 family transposase n=1 Tax=Caldinitratiruptor microaerophilus TaxID=671077 RepID=A0AA35CKQ5_9FIRM|nr:IS21 family transposase [Caldinitratiruptor microaerophilus]